MLATGETAEIQLERCKSWIFVFDIDQTSDATPHPLIITDMIAASSAALLENAFDRVTKKVVEGKVVETYRRVLSNRIQDAWSKNKKGRKARLDEL